VNDSSTNGLHNVSTDGTYIHYTNSNIVADEIFYTVQDVRTNPPTVYRLGDSVRTAIGTLVLLAPPSIASAKVSGSAVVLRGAGGIPNGTYYVLSSTNVAVGLSNWMRLGTNTFDNVGNFSFTNTILSGRPVEFYLLQAQQPF
jgi:hypothetical protein